MAHTLVSVITALVFLLSSLFTYVFIADSWTVYVDTKRKFDTLEHSVVYRWHKKIIFIDEENVRALYRVSGGYTDVQIEKVAKTEYEIRINGIKKSVFQGSRFYPLHLPPMTETEVSNEKKRAIEYQRLELNQNRNDLNSTIATGLGAILIITIFTWIFGKAILWVIWLLKSNSSRVR